MSVLNNISPRPLKVSEMQALIRSGQFANWISEIQKAQSASIHSALYFMTAEDILKAALNPGAKVDEKLKP